MTDTATAKTYEPARVNPQHQRALRVIKGTATFEDRFVPNHNEVVELIAALRAMGCVIAFTTGNWDLFHIGHAEYIARGKKEAAKLYPEADHVVMVVGIDTDEMTKKRKGPTRPIVPESERSKVLSHLRAVDLIVPQYEPDQLYCLVEHDVRVISTSTGDLPEHDEIRRYCQHLVNLPPQAETSTTARIRRLAIDGSLDVVKNVTEKLTAVLKEVTDELGKQIGQ